MSAPASPAPGTLRVPPSPAPTARAIVRWVLVADAAALVLVLAALAAPSVPATPLVAFIAGFAAVSTSMVATALATPPLPRAALSGVLLAIAALVLVFALDLARGANVGGAAIVTIALLLGGTCVGAVVAGGVEHPGHLLVVAVVFTLVDTFSVFHEAGPSAAIVASETVLSLVALPWPQLGAPTPTIEPFLGVGDVVATALFVGVARKHALGLARTAAALLVGLAVTMTLVVVMRQAIPVLPLLAGAMLVAHPAARRLRREDRRPALLGLLALMLVYVAIWQLNR